MNFKQTVRKDYTELAVELASGRVSQAQLPTNFSVQDADAVLRQAFLAEIGVEKIETFSQYRRYQPIIFEIIEETISPIINDRLEEQMGSFAEVSNVAWGDTKEFIVENPELFEVAVIADGTGNLRRQRLDNGRIPMTMHTYGVSIYEEFYRFLAGRINWAQVVTKVADSYSKKIAEEVSNALFNSYNAIDPMFKYTGTYNEDQILRVCQNIEALYGSAVIVGTKSALRPLKPSYVGDATKDQYNVLGHVGIFNGYETVALQQSFKAGTYDFNLSDTDLLVLPALSNKFVKIVTEGTPIIIDEQNKQGDLSIEHTFIQKAGVAVSYTDKYGMIRLS